MTVTEELNKFKEFYFILLFSKIFSNFGDES
jgi:hypothetical protein